MKREDWDFDGELDPRAADREKRRAEREQRRAERSQREREATGEQPSIAPASEAPTAPRRGRVAAWRARRSERSTRSVAAWRARRSRASTRRLGLTRLGALLALTVVTVAALAITGVVGDCGGAVALAPGAVAQ